MSAYRPLIKFLSPNLDSPVNVIHRNPFIWRFGTWLFKLCIFLGRSSIPHWPGKFSVHRTVLPFKHYMSLNYGRRDAKQLVDSNLYGLSTKLKTLSSARLLLRETLTFVDVVVRFNSEFKRCVKFTEIFKICSQFCRYFAETETFSLHNHQAQAHQSVSQMLRMSQKTHWSHNLISFNQVKTF